MPDYAKKAQKSRSLPFGFRQTPVFFNYLLFNQIREPRPNAQMLEKNIAADENEDHAADKLGAGFVARSENVADLQADSRKQKRDTSDHRDGKRDIDIF